MTTEQFANEMIYALRNDKIEAFKNKFRYAGILCHIKSLIKRPDAVEILTIRK
ncbi:MAG: hypothetical protein ACWGQW_19630 [bacterium]